ncbi:hypothetical protein T06_12716 [Trichinella sp. T6]|nr:hypothetical protein T06_12716 [Trichinella sp. T6]
MLIRRRRRASETDKTQSDSRQTSADQDADPPAPPGGSLHSEKKSFPPFPFERKIIPQQAEI